MTCAYTLSLGRCFDFVGWPERHRIGLVLQTVTRCFSRTLSSYQKSFSKHVTIVPLCSVRPIIVIDRLCSKFVIVLGRLPGSIWSQGAASTCQAPFQIAVWTSYSLPLNARIVARLRSICEFARDNRPGDDKGGHSKISDRHEVRIGDFTSRCGKDSRASICSELTWISREQRTQGRGGTDISTRPVRNTATATRF